MSKLQYSFDTALEQLFTLLKNDRNYRECVAQKGFAAMLGKERPDVREYGKRLLAVIH